MKGFKIAIAGPALLLTSRIDPYQLERCVASCSLFVIGMCNIVNVFLGVSWILCFQAFCGSRSKSRKQTISGISSL